MVSHSFNRRDRAPGQRARAMMAEALLPTAATSVPLPKDAICASKAGSRLAGRPRLPSLYRPLVLLALLDGPRGWQLSKEMPIIANGGRSSHLMTLAAKIFAAHDSKIAPPERCFRRGAIVKPRSFGWISGFGKINRQGSRGFLQADKLRGLAFPLLCSTIGLSRIQRTEYPSERRAKRIGCRQQR